jgi:hypothetical protein
VELTVHVLTPGLACLLCFVCFLLQALKYGMHMVMLTVQKSNATAWAFYTKLGYKQHPSCPERNGFEDFDEVEPGHRILFKDLRRS